MSNESRTSKPIICENQGGGLDAARRLIISSVIRAYLT